MLVKLEQFAPDVDYTTPGVMVECQHLIPTVRSYIAAPTATDTGFNALASACYGAAVVRKLDNSTRYIAGLGTKLYELDGAAWVDVSRVAAYNATADVRWDFAQFGNVTIACNKGDTLQFSTTALADFADISGAPKAKLVETVNQFVIVADTNDGSFGDSPDRWWCCAIGDYTDWTPDTATQCVSGRLTSSPGRINALKRLGDSIVAYKERAIFIGSYVGAPDAWSFQEVPGQVGCLAQNAIVDIGAAHIFLGADDFYIYDGSRPTSIGNPIKNWFFADMYQDFGYRIQAVHDRTNSNVYFFYPSTSGSGALDSCIVYNYRVNKWGVDDRTIAAAVDFISAGLTWGSTFATGNTWAGVDTSITWDSPLLVAGQPAPAYIGTDHKTYTLTGAPSTWSLTTGDFGDDNAVTTIKRVKPRFFDVPTTATLENSYRMIQGASLTLGVNSSYSNGRFDLLRAARWHRFTLSGTGGGEISGLDVQASMNGSE